MKKNLVLFLALVMVAGATLNAQEFIKDFKGHWEFECADAPYEYATGDMAISGTKSNIKIKITYSNGVVVHGESAKMLKGALNYTIYTEAGDEIEVSLKKDGKKITGTVYLSDGEELAVTASRKAF